MLKASAIIAVHNGQAFIADAVRSVFAQTCKDLELIVVDDASTDCTPDIVQTLMQAAPIPMQYLRNEQNLERCFSRNRGAAQAVGKYLFFLDYDDMWQPDYIETILHTFSTTNADMVCSILRTKINEQGQIIYSSRKVLPNDVGILSAAALIGGTPGVAVQKASFVQYDDAFRFREDWELVLRTFLSGLKIAIDDSNKVLVREHGKRTSRANPKYYHASLRIYETYRKKIPLQYQPFFDFEIGSVALRYGDMWRGWKLVASALPRHATIWQNPRNWLMLFKRGFRIDRWLSPSLRSQENM
ncbi:MAG: glycosyltransferase [Candidatus Thermochlorobacter aerophilum]|jgi:glycosyltransferase involved in cell wall biosynthesis|uniref:Glycosyltransferase n=1 Tax=Candidatus Thermochlorobacter aerophilus TaxID=1868324 RepID=A0A395LXU7_9BACT|nr:MAG: glycosyltransferase [Candidatus Thermochlorobacter aerophilum]